ncbi:hypothetical protein ACEPAG_2602 [Sanghuangporus baumii]
MTEERSLLSSSASRGSVLQRGKACIRCRRRKMKCDGVRPICTPCIDANRADDCEYTDNHSITRTQLLEENVARLESRLQELEGSPGSSQTLTLRDPYVVPRLSTGCRTGSQTSPSQMPSIPATQEGRWEDPDPPSQMSEMLISIFLPNSRALGFALDVDRFRERTSLPTSHIERPHPALLDAVYVWALRLSSRMELRQREDACLQRAILALQGSTLNHGEHAAHHRVEAVQAEVLIALYFLCLGHNFEARYHANAAVALAFSCSLHQVKEANENLTALSLPPPSDDNERAERIRVFWSVFELDSCWSAELESPRSFTDNPTRGTQIDTPWTDVPVTETLGKTVQRFLLSEYLMLGDDGPHLASRSKASAIYGKTWDLAARSDSVTRIEEEVRTLAHITAEFARRLPSLDELDAFGDDVRLNMAVTHAIIHASMIHLHHALTPSATPTASDGLLTHADEIVSILEFSSRICFPGNNATQSKFPDPFLAVCGWIAGRVLIEEIDRSMHGPRTHEIRSKRWKSLQNLGRLLSELHNCAGFANTLPIFSRYAIMIEDELPRDALREVQEIIVENRKPA